MTSSNNLINGSVDNSEELNPPNFNDAYFTFNEKIQSFVDSVHFLGKFSDTLKIDFAEGLLKLEALTASKSAYGSAVFASSCFQEWDLGSHKKSSNRAVTLSARHLTWAVRGVSKLHSFTIKFSGELCTKTIISYVNNEEVTRTFELACRDLPIKYDPVEYERSQFCNHLSIETTAFDKYFQQLHDDDGLRFRIEEDSVYVEKVVEEVDKGRVANVFCTMPMGKFEDYNVELPMSFTISCKELKIAFKLISSYAHIAELHFEPGNKPIMMTFDDSEQDVTCQIMISISCQTDEPTPLFQEEISVLAESSGNIIARSSDQAMTNVSGNMLEKSSSSDQPLANVSSDVLVKAFSSLLAKTSDQTAANGSDNLIPNSSDDLVTKPFENISSSTKLPGNVLPESLSHVLEQNSFAGSDNILADVSDNILAKSSDNIEDYMELVEKFETTNEQNNVNEELKQDVETSDYETPSKKRRTSRQNMAFLVLDQLGLGDLCKKPWKRLETDLPSPKNIIVK